MKLASLASFLTKKADGIRLVCFYGSDEGLMRLRTHILGTQKRVEEGRVLAYEEAPVSAAPSLWGGASKKRCVILSKPLDQKGVEAALLGEDVHLFTHASLTTKSAFFKAFESHPQVALVACYDPSWPELEAYVGYLQAKGLCALTSDAKDYLRAHLGDIIQHLPDLFEKLMMLWREDEEALDAATLETLLPPLTTQKHALFTQAFLSPSRTHFIQRLETFSGRDADLFGLMRQLLTLVKMLHTAFLSVQEGKAPSEAVRATRFPGFFGKESHLGTALSAHTHTSMEALLQLFWDMEKGAKSTHTPPVSLERLLVRAHVLLHRGAGR